MAKYIILDTETTGSDEHDRIIQLGFMVLDGSSVEVYNEYCSSDIPISFGAMEAHNITPDMIATKPKCTETVAYKKLLELNSDENYIIIHNAPFDISMLEKEGFNNHMRLIDTLKVARHVLQEQEYHRLQYLRYSLGIYTDEVAEAIRLGIEIKAHDAIGDVLILKLLLTKLRERIVQLYDGVNPIEKMLELTITPVFNTKPLKFGKYKGQTLLEIVQSDRGYLEWMRDKMENLDDDMRYSIDRVLNS